MNIGFIGTGWPDRVQIEVYKLAGLQPYGVASGLYENAIKVQKKHNLTKAYDHWQELVNDPAIYLVSITTPTFLHFEMLKYAIEQDKHVICQAPFLNHDQVTQLQIISAEHPSKNHIIDFELRFVPAIRHLRQSIASGQIGEVLWIELEYRNNFGLNASNPYTWEHNLSKGGGVLNTVTNHLIDLSQWLMNEQINEVEGDSMIAVSGRMDANNILQQVTGDQHVQLSCRFANNVMGRILTTSLSTYKGIDIRVHGSKGCFHLKDNLLLSKLGDSFANNEWTKVQVEDIAIEVLGPELGNYLFANGTYHFAQSLINSSNNFHNAGSLNDASKVQVILDKVHASIKEKN